MNSDNTGCIGELGNSNMANSIQFYRLNVNYGTYLLYLWNILRFNVFFTVECPVNCQYCELDISGNTAQCVYGGCMVGAVMMENRQCEGQDSSIHPPNTHLHYHPISTSTPPTSSNPHPLQLDNHPNSTRLVPGHILAHICRT